MAPKKAVLIGASAGGLPAIIQIVSALPEDFPAAVFVVVHLSGEAPSVLPQILERSGHLPAVSATDGARVEAGTIYVAPPGLHLTIRQGAIRLDQGPRVNRFRPAIDTTLSSAAQEYGPDAIGVVLSGLLDDGTAGLAAIGHAGGVTIVQDPEDALFSSMPASAIRNDGPVDYILSVPAIAEQIVRLVQADAERARDEQDELPGARAMEDVPTPEQDIQQRDFAEQVDGERAQQPSVFTCPECGGVLWEFQGQSGLRYRCHVGHEYGGHSLVEDHSDAVERALWGAVRSLVESAALARRMERWASARGQSLVENRDRERAEVAEGHADVLRAFIESSRGEAEAAS